MNTITSKNKTTATTSANSATIAVATKDKPFHVRAAATKVIAAINAGKNPAVSVRDHWRVVSRALGKSYLLSIANH